MTSSILSVCLLNASNSSPSQSSGDNYKCLHICQKPPQGQNYFLVRATILVLLILWFHFCFFLSPLSIGIADMQQCAGVSKCEEPDT